MLMRTFLRPWVQKEKKENDQGAIKKKDYQVKGSIEVSCKHIPGVWRWLHLTTVYSQNQQK